MDNKWKQVKLNDVCNEITVGYVSSMADEYVYKGIPFLRSQDVLPYKIDLSNTKFINAEFHTKLRKSSLKPNDVVVVRTGYPGTAAVVPSSLNPANCADLVIIRVSDKIDPHFLTYIFNSVWGKKSISGNLVGAAQQHFNVGAAKNLKINLPPKEKQQKIVSILNNYNDLIENNEKRIKILEEMAQRLYTEWFVKFKFPGHEKVKMVDSGTEFGLIPEQWEVATVESLLIPTKRKTKIKSTEYLNDGFAPVIDQGKDIIAGYTNNQDSIYTEDLIVFGDHTRCFKYCNFPFACGADGTQLLKTNDTERMPQILLFYTLINAGLGNYHYARHFKFLKTLKVLKPDSTSAKSFERAIATSYNFIKYLRQVNINTGKMRDLLIPQLVTGKRELKS